MDERKPTYKELLEENKEHHEHRRFWDVYISIIVCVGILCIFNIINLFAILGANTFIEELSLGTEWEKFIYNMLKIGAILINAYLVWHFIFVLAYNYEDEIRTFIEHWRKTKESIREENKQQFNPPE